MLEFNSISLIDADKINNILSKNGFAGSEYCFINNYIWSKVYDIKYCIKDGFYIIKVEIDGKTKFLYPAGEGNLEGIIQEILDYCSGNNIPFCITGANEDSKQLLESIYKDMFLYEEDRDNFDYIYLAEDLATLKGKKYHSKRNHINRFFENDWSIEMINRDNINQCIEMNKKWCEYNNCDEDESKRLESIAVNALLKEFFDLNAEGMLLKIDDEVVGYTIGEPINENTFIVHVEKAFSNIQGSYPMINKEFSSLIFEKGYEYINREEDLGIEQLRKAKLSYNPYILYKKYIIKKK